VPLGFWEADSHAPSALHLLYFPVPMLGLLISTPWHLLNRALFSTVREGAIQQGQPPGGCAAFIPRCQNVRPGCSASSLLNGLLGRHLRGAGVHFEAGCVPTPDHCVCAKVSHSVSTRRAPWGGSQLCSARSLVYRHDLAACPLPTS
jgi:hypothetical protein